ncbi:hypothetical protein [Phycicoccus sp.]|uniref:hypothetical protein n=1 Tax=Phycicoccus sp. TaxID=1902410 RepID=UPI002CF173E8|nr:hypothetical protein [Phycicoccus sp.]HMM95376.1 hypothetical protein [Phycicoccus sp.]
MTADPRASAARVAVREHLYAHGHEDLTQVTVDEVVDIVLATLPEYRPGQLAAIRLAEEPEGELRENFEQLAQLLVDNGLRPVFLLDADLTVVPDPEDLWRASWSSDAAGRLHQLTEQLATEAGAATDPADEHGLRVAATRLSGLIPELLDLSTNTPPVE